MRSKGEGVLPQESYMVKLKVLEFAHVLKELEGKFDVFFGACTLRPETMYGQTNCYILPIGSYGVYQINNTDAFVITERSARNLSYQGYNSQEKKVKCLIMEIKGKDLIGTAISAPNSFYEKIYVLPMLTILMTKGTGIVTSVQVILLMIMLLIKIYKKKNLERNMELRKNG